MQICVQVFHFPNPLSFSMICSFPTPPPNEQLENMKAPLVQHYFHTTHSPKSLQFSRKTNPGTRARENGVINENNMEIKSSVSGLTFAGRTIPFVGGLREGFWPRLGVGNDKQTFGRFKLFSSSEKQEPFGKAPPQGLELQRRERNLISMTFCFITIPSGWT